MKRSAPITVSLPTELARFVEEWVASGRFSTPEEVITEGLRRLADTEARHRVSAESLRRIIEEGASAADRGDVFDADFVFDELAERSRRRRDAAA